jgi:hypothetical protein
MHVEFTLPQRSVDPKDPESILRVARRIESIRYGKSDERSLPYIEKDGSVHFPLTNDFWLYPPGTHPSAPYDHWSLFARYATQEELNLIANALKLWLM